MDASGNNKITTYGQLQWTGSYVTAAGGDLLDLSPIAAQVPSGYVPDSIMCEMNGGVGSFSATGGYVQIMRHPTNVKLNTIIVFAAGGAEQGSGTYASIKLTAATEYVPVAITWKKLVSQP